MNTQSINTRINSRFSFVLVVLVFVLLNGACFSQQYRWRSKPQHTWIFGLGFQAIDDYNVPFGNVFNGNRTWHILPYPSRFNLERNLKYGFGVGGNVNYNTFLAGKMVNEQLNNTLIHVVGIDAYVKYRFNANYKKMTWFDPYLAAGLGYTWRFSSAARDNVSTNIHVGSNFWFTQKFGVQIESSLKLALGATYPSHPASYLQHSLTFLYRIYPSTKQRRDKARYKWTKKKPKGNVNRI
jgi:hypothetical protein